MKSGRFLSQIIRGHIPSVDRVTDYLRGTARELARDLQYAVTGKVHLSD